MTELKGYRAIHATAKKEKDAVALAIEFNRGSDGWVDIEVSGSMPMQHMVDAAHVLWKYFEDNPLKGPLFEREAAGK
jgi:hypothetical protein